jgi:hypothetical protein
VGKHLPLFTRRGGAAPGEQHAWIIGLDHHAMGIGSGHFCLMPKGRQVSPTQIAADNHFTCRGGIYPLGLRRCDRHGVYNFGVAS